MTFRIALTPSARRALTDQLPEAVATAVVEFIYGALAREPHRVGKPLRGELTGWWSARRGAYRVLYAINDREVVVTVVRMDHRTSVYRA